MCVFVHVHIIVILYHTCVYTYTNRRDLRLAIYRCSGIARLIFTCAFVTGGAGSGGSCGGGCGRRGGGGVGGGHPEDIQWGGGGHYLRGGHNQISMAMFFVNELHNVLSAT